MRAKLDELTLSNKAIWDREHARPSIKCVPTHAPVSLAAHTF